MKANFRKAKNSLQRGQTLVMALIIMGVLLVLGVVFVALVSRNIRQSVNNQRRSVAYDLAEAGVRYAHTQMLNSDAGADWRPSPSLPVRQDDPDYAYLRMPNSADPQDQGGPDKKGFYCRLVFDRGRALIRVRYAPSDPTVFAVNRVGNLFQAGLARNYTIIDAVGKAGSFNPGDPTQSSNQFGVSKENTEVKAVIAFVSIGLIEQARFETNKFNVSTPAEFGFPNNVGAT